MRTSLTLTSSEPSAPGRSRVEARGSARGARFKSLWASEHSHLPGGPGGGGPRNVQANVMDPFLTLTAAAMSTRTLGTGICLVDQRDPIQTAKLVASVDQLRAGLPVRYRQWLARRRDEEPRHGLRHAPSVGARAGRSHESNLDGSVQGTGRNVSGRPVGDHVKAGTRKSLEASQGPVPRSPQTLDSPVSERPLCCTNRGRDARQRASLPRLGWGPGQRKELLASRRSS